MAAFMEKFILVFVPKGDYYLSPKAKCQTLTLAPSVYLQLHSKQLVQLQSICFWLPELNRRE